MTIATLRSALPDWAKDLSLNLSTLTRATTLTEQQRGGRSWPRPPPPVTSQSSCRSPRRPGST